MSVGRLMFSVKFRPSHLEGLEVQRKSYNGMLKTKLVVPKGDKQQQEEAVEIMAKNLKEEIEHLVSKATLEDYKRCVRYLEPENYLPQVIEWRIMNGLST